MSGSRALIALGAITALFAIPGLAACGDDEGGAGGEVAFDSGVTEEPCPDGNPERGCIYLGTLSDLTVGPFAPLGVQIASGQEDFWSRVSEVGGIGGKFDVDVTEYLRDTRYNPQRHVAALREIEPDVAAVAHTLGTPPTLATLDLLDQSDLVAVPATWWSGWSFAETDRGLILESGQPYCIEAMNMLDYAADEYGDPKSVLAVGYLGDYGSDSQAGAEAWGEANGVGVETLETAPNAITGNQDAVISEIRGSDPDVVVLATGPAEMAEIVGGAVAGGFSGRFMGSSPTFNPAVLEGPAGDAITASFEFGAPWGTFGSDSVAHAAMEEAVGENLPANDGYTSGWVWSYPMLALLGQAVEDGNLTREHLREIVSEITVDYEGALPEREYAPDGSAVRGGVIVAPDEKALLSSSVVQGFAVGSTAQAYEFSGACSGAE